MRVKSKVSITVKGLNQERAFNELSKEVCILRIERTESKISTLEVKPRDVRKVKKFLKNNNFEILNFRSYGLSHFFKRFFASYGVLAAIIFSVLIYFIQLPIVWKIRVFGNENISSQEICQCIEEDLSRFKSAIDTSEIELRLKENFERISSVSVAIIGQSLVVNINEKILPEELIGQYQPLISEFDGMITDITLISGTLMVKEGDIVRKGEVLVQPYIIDTDGQQRSVVAQATISADVWLTGTSTHMQEKLVTSRTGRQVKLSEVLLFGLTIYSHSPVMNFEEYEVEEEIKPLISNNLLPLKLKTQVFYETKTQLIISDFEQEKDNIIASAREKALLSLQEYEIIKEESYAVESMSGVSTVNYTITVNRIIGGNNASTIS